jgi:crossover junction endodeoxyribonuclease RusA
VSHAAVLLDATSSHPRVLCRVQLPVAPSANRYWRVWRNRAVRTKDAENYRSAVAAIIGRQSVYTGPVAVTMHWYREARRGDLNNRTKILLDALEGCVYENDRQIVEEHYYRHEDPACPRFEVTVEARGT